MKLCVPTIQGFQLLKMEDIIVCEAEKDYTIIHQMNKKPFTVARPLMEYEALLARTGFLRVHRTYLINLLHIKEYHRGDGGMVIMSNGAAIEISRNKKDLFLSTIKEAFHY